MSTRDINSRISKITPSDTLTDFMTKCNDNFTAIVEMGGGMKGADGEKGSPGSPTKPKVPIHVWTDGNEYEGETPTADGKYVLNVLNESLQNSKYQEGHLILLQNAHVYILTAEDGDEFNLRPRFLLGLQSYDINDVINGKNAYIHIAYANSPYGDDFITDQKLRGESQETESVATFNLLRAGNSSNTIINNRSYIGVYSSYNEKSSEEPEMYTWSLMRGVAGDKGERGDGYTGQLYSIDLEGDMSTMTIGIDRTPLIDDDYCACILHAYYGSQNVKLNIDDITIDLQTNDNNYYIDGNNIYLSDTQVGQIVKTQYDGNDVYIKFIPSENFIFPKKTLIFSINVVSDIIDGDNDNTYTFTRDTVWMVKGLVSNFKLEIIPQYRTIKRFKDGIYFPETLYIDVYKVENGKRTHFDFTDTTFKLLYKNYNTNEWLDYTPYGIPTKNVSCLEFKVVKYIDVEGSEPTYEEIWDYEDVWVVADGKDAHYYHADLGNTESMMVLTTGQKVNIGTTESPIYCAELRNKDGYSIKFNPQLFDGTTKYDNIKSVTIGSNSSEAYYTDGSFIRELKKNNNNEWALTVSRVPYGVDVISMNITVKGSLSDSTETIEDSVPFNIYISTISDIYTLETSPTIFNTSTDKDGNSIECKVFKNNTLIETANLNENGLILKYTIYSEGNIKNDPVIYSEPVVYGVDDDNEKNNFTASDVSIEFTLYYIKPDGLQEISKATVPLIKDGIDGRDGDTWQYIFCKSPKYPFNETGISDPSEWKNAKDNSDIPDFKDSSKEYFGEYENNYDTEPDKFVWYDDHQGVDSEFKYEYQSYRKWDKINKCWDKYTSPTLYSNYSEDGKDGKDGSGYSVLLSNPVAVIPVGDDWKTDENSANQSDSTLVYLYSSILDISKNSNVTISILLDENDPKSKFFSISKEEDVNKITFNPIADGSSFDFGSNTQYKLPIGVKYSLGEDIDNDNITDCFATTINWTLTPVKGLEDIEVFVSDRIFNITNTTTQTFNVGYYLISSNGNRTFINNAQNDRGYQIKITDDIPTENKLTNIDIVSNWESVICDFSKNKKYYVVLVKSDGTIIDYTDISSIKDGTTPEAPQAPVCTSVSIIGYSLNSELRVDADINESHETDENKWFPSLDNLLGKIAPGEPIYMLNEFRWSVGDPTRSITTTLSGTQGVDGKSRVLFYLGSFEDGTLTGDEVMGHLTDERCDYYIDMGGDAWMRTGSDDSTPGFEEGVPVLKNGADSSPYWKSASKVGFLQAGAIHADMINTESLATDSAFINKLFTQEIEANNLKVNAANIIGTLTIGSSSDSDNCVIIDGEIPEDNIPTISETKIADGAITTAKIQAESIEASHLKVDTFSAIEINANQITSGFIDVDRIDVDNLSVKKLNTTGGDISYGTIYIENNDFIVYNHDSDDEVVKITGNEIKSLPKQISFNHTVYGKSYLSSTQTFGALFSGTLNEWLPNTPTPSFEIGDIPSISYPMGNKYTVCTPIISSIQIPSEEYNYKYLANFLQNNAPKLNIHFYRTPKTGDGSAVIVPAIGCMMQLYFDICITKLNTTPDDLEIEFNNDVIHNINTNNIYNVYDSDTNIYTFVPFFSNLSSSAANNRYWETVQTFECRKIFYYPGVDCLREGEYTAWLRINLCIPTGDKEEWRSVNCQNISTSKFQCEIKNLPINGLSTMSPNGFKYIVSDTKYASLTKDGSFIFRNGNYVFVVDDKGIALSFDGNETNPNRINSKNLNIGGKDYNILYLSNTVDMTSE